MQRSRFLAFLAVALTIVLVLTGVSGFILESLAARHPWPEFSLGTSAHRWHFVFGSMVFAAIGVIGAFLAESRIFGQIKQTEAALRESEDRFRDLIENADLGIQITTRDSGRLFVNKAYAELFGYESPEEIKALPPFALVAPHDRERLRRKRQGLLAGKPTPLAHDYDGVRKDGSIIQLESFGRRLVWQGEDAIQRTCVDVTRQRRAEADLKQAHDHLELRVEERTAELRDTNAALRESEKRYRSLVELSQDGVIVRDQETYLFANQAAARLLGYPSPDHIVGRNWIDFVCPDEREAASGRYTGLFRKDCVDSLGVRRMRGKDGTEIVLETRATAITWQGRPAVLGLWRDVTQRTRAEGELRDSEERFRQQFRSGPVPTYLWQWREDDFIRIEENDAATELKGGRTRKNDGRTASQIYSLWPEGLQCMKKCFAERTTIRHMGLRPSLAPRGPRWAQTSFVFIPPDLVMVHVVDIDEQKRSEEALRAAKEEAERANVAKSRFLAAASHDLRQPLQALEFSVATLEGRVRDPKAREIIANVDRSIGVMEDLLNALLDMSNLEAGVVEPRLEDFSVSRILENMARMFAPLAADQGIGLRMVPSRAMVRSDPALLERIVQNFTANAIRHSDAGKILLGCRHTGGSLRIEVHDSGKGIPHHEQKEIFEEFYQVDNQARDRRRGFGLGLAIVERTARLLGHRIGLSSIPGRGTAFSVNVPLAAATHRTAGETKQGRSGDSISGAFIVVIEDEPDVLAALELLLEVFGCTVLAAAAGEQAAARLHGFAKPPDAIIADYRLDGGTLGTDAIRTVQQAAGGGVPGILLTGDTSPERIREARASGFRLMHKPVRTAVLKSLLAEILGSAASHRKPGNRPGVL